MMNQTMKIVKVSEIRRLGTEALVKALGPVGMAGILRNMTMEAKEIIQKKNTKNQIILLTKF